MSTKNNLLDFIVDNIDNCKTKNGNISWAKLIGLIQEEFPDENTNTERIRSIWRREFDKGYQARDTKRAMQRTRETVEEAIVKRIKKKYSIIGLAEKLGLAEDEVIRIITNLQFAGYNIMLWEEDGIRFAQLTKNNKLESDPNEHFLEKTGEQIRFAVISDTHIGHKQARREKLKGFINHAYEQGIRDIFHAGDVTEGHYMSIRPTSIKELEAIGFDDQLDLANETFPKLDGLTYHMISGNHDGSFSRNSFANPVRSLARERNDIKYLGHNYAKIWLNEKIDISLVHPDDGIGQNYSLKMRQHIDRARKAKLSRFIFMGHYHKFDHTHYNGIDGWIMPAFVAHSKFMDTKNLASIVGAIIFTLNIDKEGNLVSFTPEYFFFNEE